MEASLFQDMASKWPSAWVSRTEIERFTGGIVGIKTLANHDSAGTGPEGRVRIGRKIAYPVKSVIAWLEGRSTVVPMRHPAK